MLIVEKHQYYQDPECCPADHLDCHGRNKKLKLFHDSPPFIKLLKIFVLATDWHIVEQLSIIRKLHSILKRNTGQFVFRH